MKKRISILLLTFILSLGLFGCGSESKELSDYDVTSMENAADMLIQSFSVMSEEDFDRLRTYSDFELQYTLMTSGFSIDAGDFLVMMDSWQNAIKEYGAYVSCEEFTAELSNNGVLLTTDVVFDQQDAILELNFNEHGKMTDFVVNVEYSMGEILQKAGLNTLLGMGTVFAVLIFIAFIISLFRFIPALEKMFGKKKAEVKKAPEKKETKPVQAPHASPLVHVMNDAELVAIIAAAIAAAEGTTPDGFVVRSIKRRKTNHWK